MGVEDDREAALFALRELDQCAHRAERLEPERLLKLLAEGATTPDERRELAVTLQSSRSAELLQKLVGLGALSGEALVRTIRSLAAARALWKKAPYSLGRDDLIEFAEKLRDGQAARLDLGLVALGPTRRRRGRIPAAPESGPRTPAERQRARRAKLKAQGYRKASVWLNPEATAALKLLKRSVEAGTKVEDVVAAALIAAAATLGR